MEYGGCGGGPRESVELVETVEDNHVRGRVNRGGDCGEVLRL
jgi:hypothetical protein